VAEVSGSTAKRVVISSETFARAGDEGARTVVDAFGADRTHVVITMRPLADMLSSSWQQYVQTGSTQPYERWLETMLNRKDTLRGNQPEFWRKTRIDALARRWGALVGPEHVTVVSLAAAPRDFVLRTFERFVGLPEGVLVPDPTADNVSLGFAVTEVVRRFNAAFGALEGASSDVQAAMVEFGAVRHLRRSPDVLRADERIEVPQWAADRSGELMQEMLDGIAAAGVRTVGDLPALTVPGRPPVPAVTAPAAVSTEAAAELLVGMMLAAGRGMPVARSARLGSLPPGIDDSGTKDLVVFAARRVGQRVRKRLGRD
jgi:hypothetical protein